MEYNSAVKVRVSWTRVYVWTACICSAEYCQTKNSMYFNMTCFYNLGMTAG